MATSGEGSHSSGTATSQPLAQLQGLEPRVARRRLSQARHRATMAGLFSNLRKTVYSQSDLTASKWQVLNKAKSHILELEQTLDNLLKLKESFNLEDGHASSLEEVKEEYARMYSETDSLVPDGFPENGASAWCPVDTVEQNVEEEEDEEDQEEGEEEEEEKEEKKVNLLQSPDLLEFERYLNFYKQMMDLLTWNGIVTSQEAALPTVSAAISHLWQTLPEDRKASLLEAWVQKHSGLPSLTAAFQEPACVDGSAKDSGVDSQGASCSLVSTPEEILFEDAFDIASFLDKNESLWASSPSSMLASCNPENPEDKFQLYMQIIDFLKGLCSVNTQLKQEPALPIDDDMMMLRCLETFDDDDL